MTLQKALSFSIDFQDISLFKYKKDIRVLYNQIDTLTRDDYKTDFNKIKKMYKIIKIVDSHDELLHGRGDMITIKYLDLKSIFNKIDTELVEEVIQQYPELLI